MENYDTSHFVNADKDPALQAGYGGRLRIADLPAPEKRGYELFYAAEVLKIVITPHLEFLPHADVWALKIADAMQGNFAAIVIDVSELSHLSSRIIGGMLALNEKTTEFRTNPITVVGATSRSQDILATMGIEHLFRFLQPISARDSARLRKARLSAKS